MPKASSPAPANSAPPPAPLAADDLTLLRCFQRTRDEAAFAELLRRHWPMVHGVCRRHLHAAPSALPAAADAEDAAQTVFLLLARKAFWFRREVVLAGWLHHAALHTCRTLQRARLRQLHRDTEAARRATLDTPQANLPATGSDSAALPPEFARQLDDALATLPSRLRDAVLLCHLQGRTRREAGVLLGCGENTVSKRLSRALPRLRSALQKRGVTLTAPALLAALGHTAAEANAAPAPTALLLAAAKSQLSSLGAVAAALTALTAWWPAPAALILATALGTGAVAFINRPAVPAASHAAPPFASAASAPSAPVAPSSLPEPSASEPPPATAVSSVHSSPRLEKLRRFTPDGIQKFIEELNTSKATPAEVVARYEERLGLAITEDEARRLMENSKIFLLGTLDLLRDRHPRDTLAWIASMSERDATQLNFMTNRLLAAPGLDLAILSAILPPGPGTDTVLAGYRLREDAPGEATRRLAGVTDPQTRGLRLHALSESWPQDRVADAISWAAQNLQGLERGQFLAGVSYELSHRDPATTLLLLDSLRGTDALAPVLQRAMRGLVERNQKIAEVLPMVESLEGEARVDTIRQLASRWVRADQDGLIEWLAQSNAPADLQAALPAALSQFSPENRALLLDQLIATTDPAIEATLIRSATPPLYGASRLGGELVERLQTRPGLAALSADSEANAGLLWQATESVARNWTGRDGGDPRAAAAWVDRLRFATPADKAKIARLVYDQWRPSDAPAATAWARSAGLPVSP